MKQILKCLYQNSRNKEIKELIFKSFNESYHIRYQVAKDKSTPNPVLDFLSKYKDFYVRIAVTRNHNTPVSILEKLSNDENKNVRAYANFKVNIEMDSLTNKNS